MWTLATSDSLGFPALRRNWMCPTGNSIAQANRWRMAGPHSVRDPSALPSEVGAEN